MKKLDYRQFFHCEPVSAQEYWQCPLETYLSQPLVISAASFDLHKSKS
ncbi:Uncharacterised protein [Pseudomonas putida]|nr:Uncharacterised protein [Pseudomonas putida]